MGGCHAPEPTAAHIRGGLRVIMLAGFCLLFVLKHRCLTGWVIHSLRVYAGTMLQQFCGCGAVIGGLDKAKWEHDTKVGCKARLLRPPQFLVVSKEAKVQQGSSGEVSSNSSSTTSSSSSSSSCSVQH